MQQMTSQQIREKFLDFFEKNGHTIRPSASLVPENDPSVLFTTAGMQQFKLYYTDPERAVKDFGAKSVASVQKCIRTGDIDEVGDNTHLTFFEMLGNFSFGGYGKKEAIRYAHEFITKELGLKIDYVSVFEGDAETPADEESRKVWQELDSNLQIRNHNRADNFWGPTGDEGPCGPTTEIYLDGVEIWNIVFNEFYKTKDGQYQRLETMGVDTGMGLERLVTILQKKESVYGTDLFSDLLKDDSKEARIIADHIKASVFIVADGVTPSNTDRGYILRRLIRRAVKYGADFESVASKVIDFYSGIYPELVSGKEKILAELKKEEEKFKKTLERGLKEIEKIEQLTGAKAFAIYQTYGVPLEVATEIKPIQNPEEFFTLLKEHQELSRTAGAGMFKGGLAGDSEMIIKYHTATHLLQQALVDVLGPQVEQRGSNITDERLRFDFTCDHKLTEEEKARVEQIVNEKISADLPVKQITLPKAEALASGARHLFNEKYGDEVSIYFVGDSLDTAYSKEFCGGPHVERTGVLGKFKIQKEEAVAAGVRRIKAVLN